MPEMQTFLVTAFKDDMCIGTKRIHADSSEMLMPVIKEIFPDGDSFQVRELEEW